MGWRSIRTILVKSIASNPGLCLACGIVDDDKAEAVVDRLMAPDMFSGWGVRTLSSEHPAFNPSSYHLGSVSPFANAHLCVGLKRYGFNDALHEVRAAMFDAAGPVRYRPAARGVWRPPQGDQLSHPGNLSGRLLTAGLVRIRGHSGLPRADRGRSFCAPAHADPRPGAAGMAAGSHCPQSLRRRRTGVDQADEGLERRVRSRGARGRTRPAHPSS